MADETGEHAYFTVLETCCTIPRKGALAIYCGDAPKRNDDGTTSISMRAPVLLMPPEMFKDPEEVMEKVARVLNKHAGEFFSSARAEGEEADAITALRRRVAELEAERDKLKSEAEWVKTSDRLPEKPGKDSYEHVPCLIEVRGEVELSLWNCEHLCWDDQDGDDFRYPPTTPTRWRLLPAPPSDAQEGRADG